MFQMFVVFSEVLMCDWTCLERGREAVLRRVRFTAALFVRPDGPNSKVRREDPELV
jgi:hypothetical protein